MLVVDHTNIDEFMFHITGYSHRGPFWRSWIRTKWWVKDKLNGLKYDPAIKFVLLDLQRYLYIRNGKRRPVRLRFLNEKGELKSGWFIVSNKYGNFYIKETWYKSVRDAEPNKGPMVFKKPTRSVRHISIKGFVSTYVFPYHKTI